MVDPAAAAASAAAVGNAKLPAEILAPVEAAIAQGNAPGPKALAAIEEASKYLGTDYKWGGSTPQTGFDCSGLMQWSYAQSGVQIPRVTYTQIEAPNGTEIADRSDLKPGDLIFFSNAGDVHHVGMYLGDDKFLHAPQHGRRGEGLEPRASPTSPGSSRAAGASTPAPGSPPPRPPRPPPRSAAAPVAGRARRSIRPRWPRRRPRSRATRPRSGATTRSCSWPSRRRRRRKEREKHALGDVPEGDRPVAGQARPRRRAAASLPPRRRGRARRPRPPPPEAAPPAAAAPPDAAVAAASIDLSSAATDYPGDNASQAELAKWLAKQAEKSGLPPELPVMASLVESGVKNLNHGDADSVGFFQMRVGIWNKGAYAGYPDKPELQAKWFIDTGARRQAQGDRRRRRGLRQGPGEVRRVDRRRRAPRRAVPRPLPAAARRGPQAARYASVPEAAVADRAGESASPRRRR